MRENKTRRANKKQEIKPMDIGAYIPIAIILGLIIGFGISYFTFSYLGGN